MSVLEEKRQKALADATELFKDKSKEAADAYISENLMITQISKAIMAAYIKKYATSKAEQKWVKEDFKKASTKIATRKVQTVCVDNKGEAIRKMNKDGKAIAKTMRVEVANGEKYETFNLSGARKEFINHFNITPKANKFKTKEKREGKIFDEFDGLFD